MLLKTFKIHSKFLKIIKLSSKFLKMINIDLCLQEMKPPVHIWQCAQGHPVCEPCKQRPELRHCPTCRQRIVGRATLVEKIAAQVFTSSAADKVD